MASSTSEYRSLPGVALLLLLLGALTCQLVTSTRTLASVDKSMLERHHTWIARHGRVYKDEAERRHRFEIFKRNVQLVESSNTVAGHRYKLSVNKFADLTDEEFRAKYTGALHVQDVVPYVTMRNATTFTYQDVTDVPVSKDWREEGAVTAVKNQMSCGACWAFTTVAAVEGITQIKSGELISLSEQQLVDCDTQDGNNGCHGGSKSKAFQYIINNGGSLETEADYPYRGVQGTCDANKTPSPSVAITGYQAVPPNDEDALLKAVAQQPISVSIDASGIKLYSSGVFDGDCGLNLHHAVTVVGYGTTTDGEKYWLAKNSWGESWGEGGYVRLLRDASAKEGICGIAIRPFYPTTA